MNQLAKSLIIAMAVLASGIAYAQPATTTITGVKTDSLSQQPLATDSIVSLKGVVVTSAKPFIIQKTDRIVLNVAQSPVAAGGNAYEIIKRAPGVTDQAGLRFRGKNVAVYINDKPSRLTGEDLQTYLAGMPANSIEKVEIIPNPSARYEAQGGSVINIVLAKNKNFGTNGTVTAGIGSGTYGRYNTGISLNYRQQKISIYGSYDLQHSKVLSTMQTERFLNTINKIQDKQTTVTTSTSHAFRAGFDYDINKKSSFGMLIRGNINYREKNATNTSLLRYYSTGNDSSSIVTTRNKFSLTTPTINLYYKTGIGKTGQLNINADYYNYTKSATADFTTFFLDHKGLAYTDPYFLKDQSPAQNMIRSFSADYMITANKIKYEMGIKTVFTKTDNRSIWNIYENDEWLNDATKSNHFIYRETINAAYLLATKSFKKLDLQLGLRAEQTNSKGESPTLQQVRKDHYISFFPSADLTYNQSDDQQFSLSYRRKIERFGFDIVNPFIVYQNQYAYYQGNPDIRPSYSHNLELSWSYRNEWLASASYSYYMNVLAEVYRKSPDGNAMISSFDNIASANQVDVNISYTKSLFNKKLTTSNTIGGLYAGYNAPANTQLNKTGLTAYISSNNILQLGKKWKGEITANYYSPLQFGSYRFRSQFGMNIGISKNILENKGTLALSLSDVFNSNKQHYSITSFGVRSVTSNNAETRFARLTFSYRFGNKNVKASRSRKTGIDDVKSRMKN